ncbi:hypothetical protein ACPCUV_29400 [Streptomyces platensis]|uniref:hypothetical protein n=1 Tax=Streptomyces platensis TaxID=58346 RepID=UPI003C2E805D
MDQEEDPLNGIVIRDYLDQAGLLDTEEFPALKGDVTELARSIISQVETSFGI